MSEMAKRRIRRRPRWQVEIAKERINILFNLAKKNIDSNPERSRRYVQLMRKIALRYNIRLPREIKRSFCKKCNTLLIPDKTAVVRINNKTKTVNIKCLNCGSVYRYPYGAKR